MAGWLVGGLAGTKLAMLAPTMLVRLSELVSLNGLHDVGEKQVLAPQFQEQILQ